MTKRPGVFPVRAVNQYRRRDIVSYLGLRYYLANEAARTDEWVTDVAVDLVLRRPRGGYFRSFHFKDIDSTGIKHREMHFPGANEALAEAALVDACAAAGLRPNGRVFSYRPVAGDDRSGIFEHYMVGLNHRHAALTEACRKDITARVAFLDIRKFYPSISIDVAADLWQKKSRQTNLEKKYRELGAKLLSDYGSETSEAGGHLLTGPMFSHLIGNLVLSDLDELLSGGEAQYFRYVDDIALVGSTSAIRSAQCVIQKTLLPLGLELHDSSSSKTVSIDAQEWLDSAALFRDEPNSESWMRFIGSLKQFLLYQPDLAQELSEQFAEMGFRIPMPDYSGAVRESSYVQRFLSLARQKWYRLKLGEMSPGKLAQQAAVLRERYQSEVFGLLRRLGSLDGFVRKSLLPHTRYRMGRLAYLADKNELEEIGGIASEQPDLFFQSAVATAVATGQIDNILEMGGNASQAVAQPLRAEGKGVAFSLDSTSKVQSQALAVFALNGVEIQIEHVADRDPLVRFATRGADRSLYHSEDIFLRELACLHGISDSSRHTTVMDSAFDEAEEIAMDAVDQAHLSL